MAVTGLRILLPGYQIIVPLAQTASGSYLPSVPTGPSSNSIRWDNRRQLTGLTRRFD
jgi:hypothetical protein